MTVEEFLVWHDTQEVRYQLWDGEVFPVHPVEDDQAPAAMAGGTARHAVITMNAGFALKQALKRRGCTTYSSDLGVHLPTSGRYAYPDVTVVCGQPEFVEDSERTLVNPTLIVEVLSPSTEMFDRGSKATAYRHVPSLETLVLVSQDRPAVEVYARDGAAWTFTEAEGTGETVDLLGVPVALADLFDGVTFPENPLPAGLVR